MSIRTNPKKAIPLLVKRLRKTQLSVMTKDGALDAKLKDLTLELNKIEDVFSTIRRNEEELLDTLTSADNHLRNFDKNNSKQDDMKEICKKIRESTEKLIDTTNQDKKTKVERVGAESDPSSSKAKYKSVDEDWEKKLSEPSLECFKSLSIFPEEAVIKKRHTIYWWIGEGYVSKTEEKTAEEVGEEVIDELLKYNLILPHGHAESPVVNKFIINPKLRDLLEEEKNSRNPSRWILLEDKKFTFGEGQGLPDNCRTVFNVAASYLNFRPKWLAKMKNFAVLQLGRWQDLPSHHIEVGSEEFLNELKDQKQLKYLSLRGISRISNLPSSITQLESLEILDLKACHNLETLPDDIASLQKLTHLDVSQCYLLESMPKGIEKLTKLQVLKGFVIGSSSKTPCGIQDLAKLKELKRLSIHIGSEAVIPDIAFESLAWLTAVKCLKISWGVTDAYIEPPFKFPPSLEKLNLEGFPGDKIPEWLKPSKLPEDGIRLKKLYIKGGKFKTLDHWEICHKWHAEIVCLKYLNNLKIEKWNLRNLFPSLKYAAMTYPHYEWERITS